MIGVLLLAFCVLHDVQATWTPRPAKVFPLTNGFYKNQLVTYYDFGPISVTAAPIPTTPLYTLVKPDGTALAGQFNIVDSIPGDVVVEKNVTDAGNTPYWRLVKVTVPPNTIANTYKSLQDLVSNNFTMTVTNIVINCPVVPASSTLSNDPANRALSSGWYKGNPIFYFNFETNDAGVAASGNGFRLAPDMGNPAGTAVNELVIMSVNALTPNRIAGQNNIIDVTAGDPGYSPNWHLTTYVVPDGSAVKTSQTSVRADPSWVGTVQPVFINCPVVGSTTPLPNSGFALAPTLSTIASTVVLSLAYAFL